METRAKHSHTSVANQRFLTWLDETLLSERSQVLVELELRHRVLLGHIEEHLGLGKLGSPAEPAAEPAADAHGAEDVDVKLDKARSSPDPLALASPRSGSKHRPVKGVSGIRARTTGRPQNIRELVDHTGFETFFAVLIVINAVVTALEVQYIGLDTGYGINFPESRPAADTWPRAGASLTLIQTTFGALFACELLAKMVGQTWDFFRDIWNWFDSFIVFVWILEKIGFSVFMDPLILRLLRMGRILRMFRLMKVVHGLDSLHLLVSSMQASIPILIWATLMLTLIMMVCSVILNNLLLQAMQAEPNMSDEQVQVKQQLFVYFGTFSRSMLSMFEITLGNWIPICRRIVNDVHEGYSVIFIAYKCVVSFAVVKVITGVFLQETFKVATSDDEILIMQREKARTKLSRKMHALFAECDDTGDGTVSWEEFRDIIEDQRVRTWLSAMELDVRDARDLFVLLDDGDHQISAEELVKGVSRLKGPSRALDMALLRKLCTEQAKEGEATRERMMVEGRRRDTAITLLMTEVRRTQELITDLQARWKQPDSHYSPLEPPMTPNVESVNVYTDLHSQGGSSGSGRGKRSASSELRSVSARAVPNSGRSWNTHAMLPQELMVAAGSVYRAEASRQELPRLAPIESLPKLRTGPPIPWHSGM